MKNEDRKHGESNSFEIVQGVSGNAGKVTRDVNRNSSGM